MSVCAKCAAGLKPVKLKRQYIHHDRKTGRIVVCDTKTLKSAVR